MRIVSGVTPGITRLANNSADLSKVASKRLKWFDYYNSHGHNARLTCRYFGISPETFYRWKRRYDPGRLKSLEDRSHRPNHVRQPTAPVELVTAVLQVRETYPRWGKDKLVVLLHKQGYTVSTSMVGRILRRLKDRGVLREPVKTNVSTHNRGNRQRPYAVRKAKGYRPRDPGDIIQLDTLDIRPLPGVVLKHFVLPPRSPKLNGCVERAHRTHIEEFYEITDSSFDLPDIREKLLNWEHICVTVRPNQALDYLTAAEFVHQWQQGKYYKEVMCH